MHTLHGRRVWSWQHIVVSLVGIVVGEGLSAALAYGFLLPWFGMEAVDLFWLALPWSAIISFVVVLFL